MGFLGSAKAAQKRSRPPLLDAHFASTTLAASLSHVQEPRCSLSKNALRVARSIAQHLSRLRISLARLAQPQPPALVALLADVLLRIRPAPRVSLLLPTAPTAAAASPPPPAHATMPPTYRNFAQYLGERLVSLGVTHVFVVPGDFNLALLDGLMTVRAGCVRRARRARRSPQTAAAL